MGAAPPVSVPSANVGSIPRYSATSQMSIHPAPSPGELADVQKPSTSATVRPASSSAASTLSAWIWNGWTPGALRRGDSWAPTIATSPLQLVPGSTCIPPFERPFNGQSYVDGTSGLSGGPGQRTRGAARLSASRLMVVFAGSELLRRRGHRPGVGGPGSSPCPGAASGGGPVARLCPVPGLRLRGVPGEGGVG